MSNKYEGRGFLREKVRERDNHTCQKCGTKAKGSRSLDVHHTDSKEEGVFGRKYRNNKLDKLITVCHFCHRAKSERNKQLVLLRKKDPSKYTFGVLASIFKIDRTTAHEIYHRDKDRF